MRQPYACREADLTEHVHRQAESVQNSGRSYAGWRCRSDPVWSLPDDRWWADGSHCPDGHQQGRYEDHSSVNRQLGYQLSQMRWRCDWQELLSDKQLHRNSEHHLPFSVLYHVFCQFQSVFVHQHILCKFPTTSAPKRFFQKNPHRHQWVFAAVSYKASQQNHWSCAADPDRRKIYPETADIKYHTVGGNCRSRR